MNGTLHYSITFTRYRNSTRVISGSVQIQAVDFPAACDRATAIKQGMVFSDPDSEFEIVSVTCQAYHGENADPSAPGLFDTTDSDEELEP
jgi:hypothetical protein